MIQIAGQVLLTFVMTATLLMVLRRPAVQAGLVDKPTSRKRHGRPVPLIGGICIILGFFTGILPAELGLRDYQALFTGMTLLLIVGVVDDLIDVRPGYKFGFQTIAAFLLSVWGGLLVTDLGYLFGYQWYIELGLLALPFTLLCVVGLTNAINMFDGLDGLASGTTAVALGWLTLAGFLGEADKWPLLSGLLLTAVLAFLVFNARNPWRRRAASFLGDSGSMVLGFALAWFCIEAATGSEAVLPPIAIGWILALPVMDALILMGRRILRGQTPFRADREHLHHTLSRAGFTHGQSVFILVLSSFILGGTGSLAALAGAPEWLLTVGLIPIALCHIAFHARAWRVAAFIRRKRYSKT
ncbi:undecaprenyl/decaprenyl-phosphate alpha-N-acetylglucosaminyl 1-phosphate transferase [Halorhodospira halochloris]|uniref:Undecaprenyl-phosphate N-acetylglucosaminyl 1-phosphate transferase n=1 Tax=Halorhodospira halochloris TaxID=1052 RepID=A0A0X8XAP8_HALHR|nr:MraY family glycosyltransferase [Halorhodospira halochloris]MBK1651727.1 hypothetical protein [Halorhodospira halochloris]MCG5529650.1 undecaprenyl/decaprenyl-phosphate alpha-N-acetylglucosaminyl 1-phosphate transferase [Halorhodospira halochloris]MCG5548548.1 undecaprenyl/decaprenyl-phosphate alpha-N-acetylglucosaminyl 1-phosphate transferase [Halorhodospira halochloris]BAU58590.2 undecaprenyl-phosphate N-acetylglucosaminyl 1-phosphate transferase [Halorhodospira halochloris]